MISDKIFFWVLPVMYAVITTALLTLARSDGRPAAARKGAAAFGFAILAVVLDTQRAYFPSGFFTIAVPLHWLGLIYAGDAFLVRHNDRTPVRPAAALFAVGLAINPWATFAIDNVSVRVINASIVAIGFLTLAVVRLLPHRTKPLDKVIAFVMAAIWLCYVVRFVLYFALDQSQEYARGSQWSQYMLIFYFSAAITSLSLAFVLILAITTDMIERHHEAATVDALTGVANRRGFERIVARHALRREFGAVMMIDLDHFKRINDTYGHGVGDDVLAATARTLRDCCRNVGEVARVGGEEFIILVRAAEREPVMQLAELLRTAIAATSLDAPNDAVRFSASIGVATIEPDEGLDAAIRRADGALYSAKDAGRNRSVYADPKTPANEFPAFA